jgi:[ribosomal protein S5]-alanine N-acetyltransferase
MVTRAELDELYHPLPPLETERLRLDPLRSQYIDALHELYSNPAVAAASDEKTHVSREETVAFVGALLKKIEMRSGISWVMVSKEENRALGAVHLHSISWSDRRGDLGFSLAPTHWGRGLMSEAVRSVNEFCFSRLRFIKVCAQNTTDNEACHRLLLGLGFRQEGLLASHGFWNDRAHDVRQYGLLSLERFQC